MIAILFYNNRNIKIPISPIPNLNDHQVKHKISAEQLQIDVKLKVAVNKRKFTHMAIFMVTTIDQIKTNQDSV